MSVLNRVASIVSAAAVLVILNPSMATADNPNAGSRAVGPTLRCALKPTRPNYPLWPGSPRCCARPNVWQPRFTGGILRQPRKNYWDCAPPIPPPK